MSDFEAKMHQIRFRLGLCSRPRSGSLQHSSIPHSCDALLLRGRGGQRGGERKGQEGRGQEGRGGKREGRGEERNTFPHLFNPTLTTGRK